MYLFFSTLPWSKIFETQPQGYSLKCFIFHIRSELPCHDLENSEGSLSLTGCHGYSLQFCQVLVFDKADFAYWEDYRGTFEFHFTNFMSANSLSSYSDKSRKVK